MSRKQRIQEAIITELNPSSLFIEDESHRHQVPIGAETHFKVTVVADEFETLNRIHRHRLINSCLTDEFHTGLHALSLHLYTPIEWKKKTTGVPNSPACRGGKHHE